MLCNVIDTKNLKLKITVHTGYTSVHKRNNYKGALYGTMYFIRV